MRQDLSARLKSFSFFYSWYCVWCGDTSRPLMHRAAGLMILSKEFSLPEIAMLSGCTLGSLRVWRTKTGFFLCCREAEENLARFICSRANEIGQNWDDFSKLISVMNRDAAKVLLSAALVDADNEGEDRLDRLQMTFLTALRLGFVRLTIADPDEERSNV